MLNKAFIASLATTGKFQKNICFKMRVVRSNRHDHFPVSSAVLFFFSCKQKDIVTLFQFENPEILAVFIVKTVFFLSLSSSKMQAATLSDQQ